jgi:hypothetical protein
MTYNDSNIMYISLHRHDNGSFFPGTGAIDEVNNELLDPLELKVRQGN